MRLSTKKDLYIRCQCAECLGFIHVDLSKINNKGEIINCNMGHRHVITILNIRKDPRYGERYEIEIDPVDNQGSYL